MATLEMRQMTVGEILDGAVTIFRSHFLVLVGIVVVTQGPASLLNVYVEIGGGFVIHPFAGLLALVLGSIGWIFASAATLHAVSQIYLGHETTMIDGLRYAMSRAGALFIAGLAAGILIFLATLLFIIPGIIVALGYAVVSQVVVLERPDAATDALGRSWQLTKGYKGRVLFLVVVTGLIAYVPLLVFSVLAVMTSNFSPDTGLVAEYSALGALFVILGQVFALILYPIVWSSITLLYYDLRFRKEAFDLELLGNQLGDELPSST